MLFLCLCFVLYQCSVHVVAEVGVGKSVEIAEKGGERKVKVSECDRVREGEVEKVIWLWLWGLKNEMAVGIGMPY